MTVRPLLLTPPTPVGFSLPGLVAASARMNVLGDVKPILRSVGLPIRPGFVGGLIAGRESALATRLGCAETAILAAATPLLHPSDPSVVRWGDGAIRREWIESRVRRIAPASLSISGHHRAAWCLKLLGHCPETLQPLVHVCARCGREQRWLAAQGLGNCDTPGCGKLDRHGPELPADVVEDYRMFAALCSTIPAERQAAVRRLAPELAELPPATLIDFAFGIGLALQDARSSARGAALTMDSVERSLAVARGAAALRDWPSRLRTEVRRELSDRGALDGVARRRLRAGLLSAAHAPRSGGSALAGVLRCALPEIEGEIGRSFAGMDGDRILGSEAARRLGISHAHLRDHVDAGMFTVEGLVEHEYRRALYDRRAVEEAAASWRRSHPIGQVMRAFGLPRYACERIVAAGDVARETHPFALAAAGQPRTIAASLDAYLEAVSRACGQGTPPADAMRIDAVMKIVGGRLKPWRQVLDAIRRRSLPAWIADAHAPLARRILVRPRDAVPHLLLDADDGLEPYAILSTLMSQIDAMTVLNLRQLDGPALMAAGLLRFERGVRSLLVATTQVLGIARAHVATPEAAARMGLEPGPAWREITAALGPPGSPAGWQRDVFDAWHPTSAIFTPGSKRQPSASTTSIDMGSG